MTQNRVLSQSVDNGGVAISPAQAGKNAVINGGFDIWQRGTSSSGTAYLADRWYTILSSGTGTFAQESTVVPSGANYSLKFTASSTAQAYIFQAVETLNVLPLAGKTVTLSGLVAASTSTGFTAEIQYSTLVDASVTAVYTTIAATTGGTATATSTTFVPIVGTFAIPSNAKTLRIRLYTTSTIATSVVVYWGNFQLELGSVATPFSRAGGDIQGELAKCQRYYWRNTATGGANAPMFPSGITSTTTNLIGIVQHPVPMRSNPTSVDFSTLQVVDSSVATFSVTNIAIVSADSNTAQCDVTISGATAGRFGWVRANNSTSAYLGFSAEL